jgi:2-amino-4-hydroxy-6-hydroxymethyldihydropteridine diphosphokinase
MTYYLSLGANLGEREQTLREAIRLIEQQVGPVRRCSSFFYSAPWGFKSEHSFCNLCCAVESSLQPLDVLHSTQSIERSLGRTKKTNQQSAISNNQLPLYSDRNIDIDIIRAFDGDKELFVDLPELHIPHLLWTQRDFVKVPLAEIMPL